MSRVVIRPGTGRYITDTPAHLLNPETDWAFAQDALTPDGKLVQRKGWAFDGTVADVAANLTGVWRYRFPKVDTLRTLTVSNAGNLYIHNPAGAGTLLSFLSSGTFATNANWLPGCVYNGELLLCNTDGTTPLVRYAGCAGFTSVALNAGTTAGQSILTDSAGGSDFTNLLVGCFVQFPSWSGVAGEPQWPVMFFYLSEKTSATQITLESARATITRTLLGASYNPAPTAWGYPCVSVYEEGTATTNTPAATDITMVGSKFTTMPQGALLKGIDACLLKPDTGSWFIVDAGSSSGASSDTVLQSAGPMPTITNSRYEILRRLPFGSVAAHKNSLFGTGVKGFGNRVFAGPPGWDLSFPPGAVLPFNMTSNSYDTGRSPFYNKLRHIDVPDPRAVDSNKALLSSPGPLWVVKRDAVHAVDGAYPDFSQRLLASGVGCIDQRGAISVSEGIFTCGEQGIFWSPDGEQITDITDGKMNREWRALMRSWSVASYVSCGVAHGHLVVSGSFGGTARSYLYDLRRREWMGRLSNLTARYQFSARISGEIEALFFVDDAEQGRVMNFAPAINGSGIAKDGDGTSPSAQIHTAQNFIGEVNDEARLLNVEVAANVYDTGAAGSTQLDMTLEHSGGLQSGGAGVQTKTLTSIDSDATDLLDRHEREVNRSGRLHQLKLAVSPTGTNDANTKVEVSEIALSFRDGRSGA